MKEKSQIEKNAEERQIELLSTALNEASNAGGHWLNAAGKGFPKFYPRGVAVSPFNGLFMALHSDRNGCKTNLFTLYSDAKARGTSVREHEQGVPFLFYNWNKYVHRNNPEDIISRDAYLKLDEEVRHLRSIVETELAVMACDLLTEEDLDVLRENIAIWKMYMERKQTDKILQFDKEFHRHFYEMCDRNYWYTLLESLSPHFDRTTVLSFRCRPVNGIVSDHEELVDAIAARDRGRAAETARRHMLRYTENIDTIRQAFPEYFA